MIVPAPCFYMIEVKDTGGFREWERNEELWVVLNRAKVMSLQGDIVRVSRCFPLPFDVKDGEINANGRSERDSEGDG